MKKPILFLLAAVTLTTLASALVMSQHDNRLRSVAFGSVFLEKGPGALVSGTLVECGDGLSLMIAASSVNEFGLPDQITRLKEVDPFSLDAVVIDLQELGSVAVYPESGAWGDMDHAGNLGLDSIP